jgi:pimeloyl-ACP methyl ester carboxylesterase
MAKHKAGWSAELQSRYTHVDGMQLHDRGAGSGRPMVFVHGIAVSSRYFIPLVRALAPWFSCRAVDLPGFGRSEPPATTADVAGLAAALTGWLRMTGNLDAVLVGNSAGCQVIATAVATTPDLAGPVVFLGPTMDPEARSGTRQFGRWLRTSWRADVTQLPVLIDDCNRAGWARVARTFRFFLDDAIEEKLPSVSQPALVVRGTKDPIVPQRWARDAVARLPRGRLEVVAGGGHILNYTHPQSVGLIVREFLDEIGDAA